jgi:hypothetical protein
MSDFVNYKKRGVGLPPGCKDLIDLLKPKGKKDVTRLMECIKRATVKHDQATGTLPDMLSRLQTLFSSRALFSTFCAQSPDGRLVLWLMKPEDAEMRASITFEEQTDLERAVREFLASRGFKAPAETAPSNTFIPDVPVHATCDISPLPGDLGAIARLVSDLFSAVGLKDDPQLRYYADQLTDVA